MDKPPPPPPFPVIEPSKSTLTWYHWVWIGWPLIMVALGGAIGGRLGGVAAAINYKVFQKVQSPIRYLWTGIISVAAIVIYVVIVGAVYLAFHKVNKACSCEHPFADGNPCRMRLII